MSVLKSYFDKTVNQSSPIQKDYRRVVNYDEHGNEFITWEEIDYPSILQSNGTVGLWSLDALLKAGINPNFPVHTGSNTRLDSFGTIAEASAIADEILSSVNENNE